MKPKKTRSSSGNAVVRDAFLVRWLFYLSVTHAPIFHRSMWMQRNICITAATFNMIVMSSARFACVLSAVKPKQTRSRLLRTSTLRHIPPLASPPPLSSRRFYWWLSDTDLRISDIKCEWPSQSNLLLHKCGEKTEVICENGYWLHCLLKNISINFLF